MRLDGATDSPPIWRVWSEPSVTFGLKTFCPALSLSAFGTKARANSTAAAALTSPAPCVSALAARLGKSEAGGAVAVRTREALTRAGVSDLVAASTRATGPGATGAEEGV